MATAKRFEDLAVWQKSRHLARDIYRLSADWRDRSLQDQIRRAAVSVLSNIAEGFERGSNAELIQFLYIARGSCGEVRAQLYVALDAGYLNPETLEQLNMQARLVSAMLYNFIESVKGSKFKGSKFKTKRDREKEEFQQYLADIVSKKIPKDTSFEQYLEQLNS